MTETRTHSLLVARKTDGWSFLILVFLHMTAARVWFLIAASWSVILPINSKVDAMLNSQISRSVNDAGVPVLSYQKKSARFSLKIWNCHGITSLLNCWRSFPLKLVGDDAAGGDAQDAPGAPRPPRLLQDPREQINVPAGKVLTHKWTVEEDL